MSSIPQIWSLIFIAGDVQKLTLDSERAKFYTRWSLKFLLSSHPWPCLCLIMKYENKQTKIRNKTVAKQEMNIKKNVQEEIQTVAIPQTVHEVLEQTT